MPSQTADHNIPYSEGTDAANTIDDTMEALAERVDELIVAHDAGSLASRPTSTPESPGIEGRVYRVNSGAAIGMVNYDTGTGWITLRDPDPGLLASRPAANTMPVGTRHRATDTGDVSVSDGTTWFTVTPAARCSFMAYGGSQSIAAGTTAKMTVGTEDHDVGGHLASSVFTAPVKGIYEFDAQAWCNSSASGESMNMQLYKNGSAHPTHQVLDSNVYPSLSRLLFGNIQLQLSAGDTIEIQIGNAGPNSKNIGSLSGAPPRFSGKLLAQIP